MSSIFQPMAYADMVSTGQLVSQADTASMRADVMNFLSRDEVRTQMTNMGVDMADAQVRVNSMTQAELNQAHSGIDALPAGGVLGLILTLLLIFLILDIAGVTDIFPGV